MDARAKINLTLEVFDERADGFHDLRSIVMPVSFADEMAFRPSASGRISLKIEPVDGCDVSSIGSVDDNLALRAARLLKRETGFQGGVDIVLTKRIPLGSGLGGGSADAAAVLNGLDSFLKLGVGREGLVRMGAELGSDVPALVHGGVVLMEGRGEFVSAEPPGPVVHLVLVFPGVFTSTAKVYSRCVPQLTTGGGIVDNMRRALSSGDASAVAAALQNGLAAAAESLHPEIAQARAALVEAGALGASMSGSGSCVFGIARDAAHAGELAERLAGLGLAARPVHTCPVM